MSDPPRLNRAALQKLAQARVRDAGVLLRNRRSAGAYYLCGYAVECALKACIARETRRGDFPDLEKVRGSYTHGLANLVKVAGLKGELEHEEALNPQFRRYWSVASNWSERARYEDHSAVEARDLHTAVTDTRNGVLQWVKRYW